jgi:putative phosphoribosyl transferase
MVVTVLSPTVFNSIECWYEDFRQVETNEVISILNLSNKKDEVINPLEISVKGDSHSFPGFIYFTENIKSWIVFAICSGNGHRSSLNNRFAEAFLKAGHGSLVFDLLTFEEGQKYSNQVNVSLLRERLRSATKWLSRSSYYKNNIPVGYFGSSAGAIASLMASDKSELGDSIYAVVCLNGSFDMIDTQTLASIKIPTLLIAGADDLEELDFNKKANTFLSNSQIYIVPHVTHFFEESVVFEDLMRVTVDWLNGHLKEYLHVRDRLKEFEKEVNYLYY